MDGEIHTGVLSLGQQIAASLDEQDVLSRWMAHYLASRLAELESLDGDARDVAEAEVAALIVQIWEHRQAVAFRGDPLALVDSVERAISRLDPSISGPFTYYPAFDDQPGPTAADIETNSLLKLAIEVESAAKDLVRSLVQHAASVAVNRDADWVQASQAVQPAAFRDLVRLLEYGDAAEEEDPAQAARARIAARARSLAETLRALSRRESPE